jgi:hypothetical protein
MVHIRFQANRGITMRGLQKIIASVPAIKTTGHADHAVAIFALLRPQTAVFRIRTAVHRKPFLQQVLVQTNRKFIRIIPATPDTKRAALAVVRPRVAVTTRIIRMTHAETGGIVLLKTSRAAQLQNRVINTIPQRLARTIIQTIRSLHVRVAILAAAHRSQRAIRADHAIRRPVAQTAISAGLIAQQALRNVRPVHIHTRTTGLITLSHGMMNVSPYPAAEH